MIFTKEKGFFSELTPKTGFLLGISWGIAVIALVGFFVLLFGGAPLGGETNTNGAVALNTNTNVNQPSPSIPPEPEGDASKLSPVIQDDHIRGDFNAPITLIEFSDFECPFCRRHFATMEQILKNYEGKVRLVFRHFPLPSLHPNAPKDAEASECASEQGKFWEMHDKIFSATGSLTVDILKDYAKELGLDTAKFNDCLDSGKYEGKVRQHSLEGQAAGVGGTPSTFVNGELVKGALPYESFKQIIDSLLQR